MAQREELQKKREVEQKLSVFVWGGLVWSSLLPKSRQPADISLCDNRQVSVCVCVVE